MKFLKIAGVTFILAVAVGIIETWFRTFVIGAYYISAPIWMSLVVSLVPVFVAYVTYVAISNIIKA